MTKWVKHNNKIHNQAGSHIIGRCLGKLFILLFAISLAGYAISMPYQQDDRSHRQTPQSQSQQAKTQGKQNYKNAETEADKAKKITAQPILENEDSIPDSLLHPRWKVQRTTPITMGDLDQNSVD